MSGKGSELTIRTIVLLTLGIVGILGVIMFAGIGNDAFYGTQTMRFKELACLKVKGNCTEAKWTDVKINSSSGGKITLKDICLSMPNKERYNTEEECLINACGCEEVESEEDTTNDGDNVDIPSEEKAMMEINVDQFSEEIVEKFFENYREERGWSEFNWTTDNENLERLAEKTNEVCKRSKMEDEEIRETIYQVYSNNLKRLESPDIGEKMDKLTITSKTGDKETVEKTGECNVISPLSDDLYKALDWNANNNFKVLDKYYVEIKIVAKNGNVVFRLLTPEVHDESEIREKRNEMINKFTERAINEVLVMEDYMELFTKEIDSLDEYDYGYQVVEDKYDGSYYSFFDDKGKRNESNFVNNLKDMEEGFKKDNLCEKEKKELLKILSERGFGIFGTSSDNDKFYKLCEHFGMTKAMCLAYLNCSKRKVIDFAFLRASCDEALNTNAFWSQKFGKSLNIKKYLEFGFENPYKVDDIGGFIFAPKPKNYCEGGDTNKLMRGCQEVIKYSSLGEIDLNSIKQNGKSMDDLCYEHNMNEVECVRMCTNMDGIVDYAEDNGFKGNVEELTEEIKDRFKLSFVCRNFKRNGCGKEISSDTSISIGDEEFKVVRICNDAGLWKRGDNLKEKIEPCLKYCGC
ncbi:MAG: hypothetical protein ABEK36_03080 [Candidatus Aenigmatarchaeota archaeon]